MPDIFSSQDTSQDTSRDQRFGEANPADQTQPNTPPQSFDQAQDLRPIQNPIQQQSQTQPQSEINQNVQESEKETSFEDLPSNIRSSQRNNMHLFSAFSEKPYSITFQTQEDDERILLFLRKSNVTNISWIVTTLILLILPLGFLFIRIDSSVFSFFPKNFGIILLFFYYLIVATFAYVSFITWYYNVMIVTDRRIVDIDFADLVYKDIAETTLTLVQDVSYQETGVLRTIFDYGNVLIQTAGTLDNFELKALPKPERVVEVVESLIGKGKGPFR